MYFICTLGKPTKSSYSRSDWSLLNVELQVQVLARELVEVCSFT